MKLGNENENCYQKGTMVMTNELTQAELATNAETWKHIDTVMRLLASAQIELMRRQFTHDRSKLVPPEVSTFVEFTPKLKGSTYGSEEYKGFLAAMKPALDWHYSHNRHHPEHYEKNSEDKAIESHIMMAKWALKHGQVLPDDIYGYEQLIAYLERSQAEAISAINGMTLFDLLEMVGSGGYRTPPSAKRGGGTWTSRAS